MKSYTQVQRFRTLLHRIEPLTETLALHPELSGYTDMASFNEVMLLHNTPLDSVRVQRDQDAPAGILGEKWRKRKEEKRLQ